MWTVISAPGTSLQMPSAALRYWNSYSKQWEQLQRQQWEQLQRQPNPCPCIGTGERVARSANRVNIQSYEDATAEICCLHRLLSLNSTAGNHKVWVTARLGLQPAKAGLSSVQVQSSLDVRTDIRGLDMYEQSVRSDVDWRLYLHTDWNQPWHKWSHWKFERTIAVHFDSSLTCTAQHMQQVDAASNEVPHLHQFPFWQVALKLLHQCVGMQQPELTITCALQKACAHTTSRFVNCPEAVRQHVSMQQPELTITCAPLKRHAPGKAVLYTCGAFVCFRICQHLTSSAPAVKK